MNKGIITSTKWKWKGTQNEKRNGGGKNKKYFGRYEADYGDTDLANPRKLGQRPVVGKAKKPPIYVLQKHPETQALVEPNASRGEG